MNKQFAPTSYFRLINFCIQRNILGYWQAGSNTNLFVSFICRIGCPCRHIYALKRNTVFVNNMLTIPNVQKRSNPTVQPHFNVPYTKLGLLCSSVPLALLSLSTRCLFLGSISDNPRRYCGRAGVLNLECSAFSSSDTIMLIWFAVVAFWSSSITIGVPARPPNKHSHHDHRLSNRRLLTDRSKTQVLFNINVIFKWTKL